MEIQRKITIEKLISPQITQEYIKKEMSIIPELQQTIEQYPNDIMLGEAIRSKYAKYNG